MTEYIIVVGLIAILLVVSVERYKNQIQVTIIGSKGAMDAGMGPQYWAAPGPGEPSTKTWPKAKGGDDKQYKFVNGAWVPI